MSEARGNFFLVHQHNIWPTVNVLLIVKCDSWRMIGSSWSRGTFHLNEGEVLLPSDVFDKLTGMPDYLEWNGCARLEIGLHETTCGIYLAGSIRRTIIHLPANDKAIIPAWWVHFICFLRPRRDQQWMNVGITLQPVDVRVLSSRLTNIKLSLEIHISHRSSGRGKMMHPPESDRGVFQASFTVHVSGWCLADARHAARPCTDQILHDCWDQFHTQNLFDL